ncbi:MAG: hypothetical protein ACK5MI_01470 [Mangrovibacterium sp.]
MTTKVTILNVNAHNGEVNSLAQAILNKSTLFVLETDAYLLNLLGELQHKQEGLNDAIQMLRTKSLSNLCLKRMKEAYRKFYRITMAYHAVPTMLQYDHVQRVWNIILRYHDGITYSSNQLNLNSYVSSLIADLDENASDDIAAVSLFYSLLSDLKEAQETYLQNYADYQNQRKLEMERTTATEVKHQIMELINKRLALHLNAMLQVSEIDYIDFARAVSALIAERNAIIKTRLKYVQSPVENTSLNAEEAA